MRDMTIEWADAGCDSDELARFFVQNTSPEYISHGEIQDGRAADPETWQEDVLVTVSRQYRRATQREGDGYFSETRIAVARRTGGELLGVAYVGLQRDARTSYGVLYDLLVGTDVRNQGVGKSLLEWTEQQLRNESIDLLFLESGARNERAHAFFQRCGFRTVSINMLKRV